MSVEILELRKGGKMIYGHVEGKTTRVLVDCDVYEMAEFRIPTVEARALFQPQRNGLIQEIAPSVLPEQREIFITGFTPAEFDRNLGGKVKPRGGYSCYGAEEQAVTE